MAVVHYARGEYQRIRGDYQHALEELKKAMELAAPGRNQNWAYMAGGYLKTLIELEAYQQAEAEGRQFVQAAHGAGLDFASNFVQMPLAVAEAKAGNYADAVATADKVIESFGTFGTTGLSLGLAYETRARVASLMKDENTFLSHARLCVEQYQTDLNAALSAKFEKLLRDANQVKLVGATSPVLTVDLNGLKPVVSLGQMARILDGCNTPRERAEKILALLVNESHCSGGFLYTLQKEGPMFSARNGQDEPTADVDMMVQQRLSAEIDSTKDVTVARAEMETFTREMTGPMNRFGKNYRSVLLGHTEEGGFVITGLVVLFPNPSKPLAYPASTIEIASKYLLASGDVSKVYAAS
jgi:hypothetical protein